MVNYIVKIIRYLLIIVILLFYPSNSVNSQFSNYIRYSTKPILVNGPESWDMNQVRYPNVIYDEGIFKMWYSGHNGSYWSVGYALSLDGINWYKYPNNPVLTWNFNPAEPKHIITPSVIKDSGLYRMWFTSSFSDKNDGDFTIGYATSTNGVDWQILNYKQLNSSQNWDAIGLTHPFVLKLNDHLYHLYYAARSNPNNWTIGYAISTDGLKWTPYPNNPVITNTSWWERGHNIGPDVIFDTTNQLFKMWYNTTNLGTMTSIAYAESTNSSFWSKPIDKNPVLLNELPNYFDSYGVGDGSIYKTLNSYLLWYGSRSLDLIWKIGLAYFGDLPTPQPTPSVSLFPSISPTEMPVPTNTLIPTSTSIPTIIPTIMPSPTPTPKSKEPIVIIPGMFASWNKEAILEGKTKYSSPWKLLPFIKEYDGIIVTLKNLGYTENNLLYIWPYDWRNTVAENTNLLNNYLNSNVFLKHPNKHISIIGHSLGGLIARTWAQSDNNKTRINHILTVGSPNLGVIQPYRAWEGGEISQDSSVLSIATHMLLHVGKKKIQTDRETIQELFPVLKDLLPSSPYLIRKSDNIEITKSQMYVWNIWLEALNSTVSTVYHLFDAIGGKGNDTPGKFVVTTPNKIDFLLGNWQDGKPVETRTEPGDGTVTTNRSVFSDDANTILTQDHGSLITSKEGITSILNLLDIPYSDKDIHEGMTTRFSPALLFTMQSPAIITVVTNGNTYTDTDGVLLIPNAPDGQYEIRITGKGSGTYHLSIGQFGTSNTVWTDISNSTIADKVDYYSLQFVANSPSETPITNLTVSDWISQIDSELLTLEKFNIQAVRHMRSDLAIVKYGVDEGINFITKMKLEQIYSSLSRFRNINNELAVQLSFTPQETIRKFYLMLFSDMPDYFSSKHLSLIQMSLEKERIRLLVQIEKTKPTNIHILLYRMAAKSFEVGKESLMKNELAKTHIHFLNAQLLFKEALQK